MVACFGSRVMNSIKKNCYVSSYSISFLREHLRLDMTTKNFTNDISCLFLGHVSFVYFGYFVTSSDLSLSGTMQYDLEKNNYLKTYSAADTSYENMSVT